jgi:segregation and condensation protein A
VHTGLPPLKQVPLFSLVEAFQSVLSKSKIKISHDIVHERITLTDRINELVDVLRVRKRIQFEEMFDGLATRFDLVITFLAILEMTKLRMTRLHQSEPMAPIYVEFSAQIEETTEGGEEEEKKSDEPAVEESQIGTNVSDTEPPPDMSHMTDPPPAEPEGEREGEAEGEPHETTPHETIPSPPLSEDEDPK